MDQKTLAEIETTAAYNRRAAKRQARRQKARIAWGQCARCAKPLGTGDTHRNCEGCRKMYADSSRVRRATRVEQGQCEKCVAVAIAGTARCGAHTVSRDEQRRRVAWKKEQASWGR